MSYTVYGGRRSRAFRVLWALEELGVDYEHRPVGPRSEEILAVNSTGKIPALGLPSGEVIPDSTAILHHLAAAHGALAFRPGTPERARQDAWTFRILDEIEGVLWTRSKHSFVYPEDMRLPEIKPILAREFVHSCARLADDMAGDFLMEDTFTLADIVLGHCLGWAKVAKLEHGVPALDNYLGRLRDRAAYQRAASRD